MFIPSEESFIYAASDGDGQLINEYANCEIRNLSCHKSPKKKIFAKLFIYVILGSFRFISGWNQPYFMRNIIIYRDSRKANRERIFRHIFFGKHMQRLRE